MVGSTLSGGWPDRRPPVRTTPQIGPDHPPNRAGPPHKSGRTTPPIGPDRPTNRAGHPSGPPRNRAGPPPQSGPATLAKVAGPKGPDRFLRVRTVFCGPDRGPDRFLRVRTVFCGPDRGPDRFLRVRTKWPALGPVAGHAENRAGPTPESGRTAVRTTPRIGPAGWPDGRPDTGPHHSVECARSPKSGSPGSFLPIFFAGGVKDALFRPPRGPTPPPQAHHRPEPEKATTYRPAVPRSKQKERKVEKCPSATVTRSTLCG